MLYNGQPSRFALNLERDYGVGTVKMLEGKRLAIVKNYPHEQKIFEYEQKLGEVMPKIQI
jgi:hypothetical protein